MNLKSALSSVIRAIQLSPLRKKEPAYSLPVIVSYMGENVSKKHLRKSLRGSDSESRFVDSLSFVDNEIYNKLLLHHYMPQKIVYRRTVNARDGFDMELHFAGTQLPERLHFDFNAGTAGKDSMAFFILMGYQPQEPMVEGNQVSKTLEWAGPQFSVRDWLQAHGS